MFDSGFKIFNSLKNVTFMPSVKGCDLPIVKDDSERILDLIYAPNSDGWPSGAYSQFLSADVPADVRQFIVDTLMNNTGRNMITDELPEHLDQLDKLGSEFIAKCSRDRFESVERYEQRLSEYVEQLRKEEYFKQKYSDYNNKLESK